MKLSQLEKLEDLHMKLEHLQIGLLSKELTPEDAEKIMKSVRPQMLKYIDYGM